MEWCLDRSAEFVQVDFEAEAEEAREAAAVARGEASSVRSNSAGDVEGLSRVIEALQCRIWKSISEDEIGIFPISPPEIEVELDGKGAGSATVEGEEELVFALEEGSGAEGGGEVVIGGGEPQPAEEEARQDRLEDLMTKMSEMRDNRSSMPDTARREKVRPPSPPTPLDIYARRTRHLPYAAPQAATHAAFARRLRPSLWNWQPCSTMARRTGRARRTETATRRGGPET